MILFGNWSHRYLLLGMYQNSRLPERKEVSSTKHNVYTDRCFRHSAVFLSRNGQNTLEIQDWPMISLARRPF
jgi:hypothetical protein